MWLVAKYWRVKACILSSVNLLLSQRRKLRSREAEAPGAGCWSTAGVGMGLSLSFSCAPPRPTPTLCRPPEASALVPSPFSTEIPQETPSGEVVGTVSSLEDLWLFLDTQAYLSPSAPNASRTQISVLSLPRHDFLGIPQTFSIAFPVHVFRTQWTSWFYSIAFPAHFGHPFLTLNVAWLGLSTFSLAPGNFAFWTSGRKKILPVPLNHIISAGLLVTLSFHN